MQHSRSLVNQYQRQALPLTVASTRAFSSEDNFLNGANANYVDAMFASWQKDPASVHPSWNAYFANDGAYQSPPALGKNATQAQLDEIVGMLRGGASIGGAVDSAAAERGARESVQIAALCRAFQTHGHLVADVDPLNMKHVYANNESLGKKYRFPQQELLSLLDYKSYGFTEADLDREFYIHSVEKGSIRDQRRSWKLRDLLQAY